MKQRKGGDTSTAESGSDADDITSPKAMVNYVTPTQLTPVREEVICYIFEAFLYHRVYDMHRWYLDFRTPM